jgi:hypothetical protein
VVPCGSLQFENGFAETGAAGRHGLDLPETWMRFGVPAKGEIRFAVPDHFSNDDTGTGFSSGASDIVLGYKQQLGPTHGFDISVIPSLWVGGWVGHATENIPAAVQFFESERDHGTCTKGLVWGVPCAFSWFALDIAIDVDILLNWIYNYCGYPDRSGS